jgi:hypothetical protein
MNKCPCCGTWMALYETNAFSKNSCTHDCPIRDSDRLKIIKDQIFFENQKESQKSNQTISIASMLKTVENIDKFNIYLDQLKEIVDDLNRVRNYRK